MFFSGSDVPFTLTGKTNGLSTVSFGIHRKLQQVLESIKDENLSRAITVIEIKVEKQDLV